jgi:deoxyribodipyrimidine photo-lyase
MPSLSVPPERVQSVNAASVREDGSYILYWMTAQRRVGWNFALQQAVKWAVRLSRPLVILEALRCDYRWANDRLHRFAIDGMAANARHARDLPVLYYPYVEPSKGAGRGLLAALAEQACVVIADDYPAFFLPHMVAAAGARLSVRVERVDSNGLLPVRASSRVFLTAHSFRSHLQRTLRPSLESMPLAEPLRVPDIPVLRELPVEIRRRWAPVASELLDGESEALARLPIDHTVPPSPIRGGSAQGREVLTRFMGERLARYGERNQPDADAASGLSPYLHWGHVSVHEIFHALAKHEHWTPSQLGPPNGGSREGWWRMSPGAEGFLDELVTWRELGFNMAAHRPDYTAYASLPAWARATLAEHTGDARDLYTLPQLERAETSDPIWNAAQRQLVQDGVMHNYLRMLWGKRVLEWSRTPEEAYARLEELNNKYALDGRDPNSYTGILWVFGRYDRPWGPERPVFGKVRYMSSEATKRKLRLKNYLAKYAQS